jgi:hypothetical protein
VITKKIRKVDLGEGAFRHIVVLQGRDTAPDDQFGIYEKFQLLQEVGRDPALTHCAGHNWDKLRMWHDGDKWTIECEVTVGN